MEKIYLDNCATTQVDLTVLDAMIPYFTERYGNSSSQHVFGSEAKTAIEIARRKIAQVLNVNRSEIIFTSGTTESANLAIRGICNSSVDQGKHIITQVTEHKAVLETCKYLEKLGWEVTYLPVDNEGFVDTDQLRKSLRLDTVLVAIMHGNNEIGTIQPLREIGKIVKETSAKLFVDAAQTFGRIPIDINDLGIDLLAASAHKIYGPKGIGLLYLRSSNPFIPITPQQTGGGHENGIRSGTLPTPLIVGFVKATEIAVKNQEKENKRLVHLRDIFLESLSNKYSDFGINGSLEIRTPHNLNIYLPGINVNVLIGKLKTIAISAGSACTSGSIEPSHVIRAISNSERANSSIRIGMGISTTKENIRYVVNKFSEILSQIRGK